jgi:hypothetical protein
MRSCLLAAICLVMSACGSVQQSSSGSRSEPAQPITLTPKQVASVRAGVAKGLRNDLEAVHVGRILAGRTSTSIVVCGLVNGKSSSGEDVRERPFHGVFMGMDNASGFIVTGSGGADNDNAETFEVCRRSGLDLTPS